jgi:hypothetical protein
MRDMIHHPLLLELYDYWVVLGGARGLPRRADFDPFKLTRLLPSLIVNGWGPGACASASGSRATTWCGRAAGRPGAAT